ncbi:inositol 1,4,5-trisphosphate receptor-interacting protein-like 1 [Numenius arquata]|uniref:inositol 1,4,5-trisphosphate receptor-interacting protein-like 1 n=1 Tax=Numenius arquata TaxID=31919 RepID=UPI003D304042
MVRTLLVLSVFQLLSMAGNDLDEATRERMRLREECLNQETTGLLEELEQRSQEQSSFDQGALLFTTLQQWQFWAVAGVLVLLFRLCWQLRKSSHEEKEEEEEEEDGEEPLQMYRFLDEHPSWPLPRKQRRCMAVEHVVSDLLCACRILSSNSFMPLLQPAVSVGGYREGWSAGEEDLVYRLLVPLKPPPGHSFHLEQGSKGDKLVRDTRLRVTLECTCLRERRLGDMLCFLHHPEDELMIRQEANLLQTLCSGSYLDVQKTAFWLQELMRAASLALHGEATYRLMVLPSTQFCKFKLINSVKTSLYVELILAVQEGNAFVSME